MLLNFLNKWIIVFVLHLKIMGMYIWAKSYIFQTSSELKQLAYMAGLIGLDFCLPWTQPSDPGQPREIPQHPSIYTTRQICVPGCEKFNFNICQFSLKKNQQKNPKNNPPHPPQNWFMWAPWSSQSNFTVNCRGQYLRDLFANVSHNLSDKNHSDGWVVVQLFLTSPFFDICVLGVWWNRVYKDWHSCTYKLCVPWLGRSNCHSWPPTRIIHWDVQHKHHIGYYHVLPTARWFSHSACCRDAWLYYRR